MEYIRDIVGSVMALAATGAVIYMAIVASNEAAVGAMVAISAAAVGYFLRGRVEEPTPTVRPR